MIILPPYIPEWQAYPKVPLVHRWIFNKVDLGQRLGYFTEPVGLKFDAGTYCVRPTTNIAGMAYGGFKKVTLSEPGFIDGPVGYCVSQWSDEPRWWFQFVNDECWYAQYTTHIDEDNVEHMVESDHRVVLPEPLRGISRYLLVEALGDKVIDVSTRHMLEEMKQRVIDDYRQFNPLYMPPDYCTYGFQPRMRRVLRDGWWYLEEIPNA